MRMTWSWRRTAYVVAIAAGGALLFYALRPAPVVVDLGTVRRGPLRVTVEEDGETRVRERYVLTAPVAGRLVRVQCEEGDPVESGAVVARLFPLPLDPRTQKEAAAHVQAVEATRRAAEARLGQTRTVLDKARRDLARDEQLAAEGLISHQELERSRVAERTAVLERDAAQHRLQAAEYDVRTARAALLGAGAGADGAPPSVAIRAPAAGRVLRVYQECERTVTAGTPILEVGDPSDLEIVLDILTEDAARVSPGASMRVAAGADTFAARVRLVEPSAFTKVSPLGVDEQRVNVIGDFVERPVSLGDRYRVEGQIVVWAAEDVLTVSSSALFRHGDGWAVFTVVGGRALLRPVEIGHRGAYEAEVLTGLDEDARVVLFPSDRLRDAMRLKPRSP